MISLQQLVGAAERLRDTRTELLDDETLLAAVERALARATSTPFVATPLHGFLVREGEKERLIASPSLDERILEEALRPLLERALEPLLTDAVHAWRAGRSTWTAARALREALAAGRVHLLACDIADFFGSIDRTRLTVALEALVGPHAEILSALAAAPIRLEGALIATERGIPLGRPLSPLLANTYLRPLDAAMSHTSTTWLRYGDDLLVAAADLPSLLDAEERLVTSLASLGLVLKPSKTRRLRYEGAPIDYLGHLVDAGGVWERVPDSRLTRIATRGTERAAQAARARVEDGTPARVATPRTHTVYVTEPGLYLTVKQSMLCARRGNETTLEVPLHRVDRILVLAGISLSSALVSTCIAERITIVFFVGKGRAFGSLVGSGLPNPLRLRAQYDLVSRPERRGTIASDVVLAKIAAMERRLQNVKEAIDLRATLRESATRAAESRDPMALRGIEGAATRAYYTGLAMRIREPDFAFRERSRQPPKDAINSLMSFAYSLLFFEMQTALLAHGLDPHPALLHDLHRNHPALASDLIEPYRALIADSFVLTLVNDHQVKATGFETQSGGAVYMRDDTRRTVLAAWESYVARPAGNTRGTMTPRGLIDAAALAMLAVVLGEREHLELPLVGSAVDNTHPSTGARLDASGPRAPSTAPPPDAPSHSGSGALVEAPRPEAAAVPPVGEEP